MRITPSSSHARFRLRTIFLIVNLVVLSLPLGGIFFFRIYENELVRQTELELISQASVIAASFKQEVRRQFNNAKSKDKETSDLISRYGEVVLFTQRPTIDDYYTPLTPLIDLAKDTPLPQRPAGREGSTPDGIALEAGTLLTEIMKDAQKTTLSGMKILDYNGTVVSGRQELGLSFAHLPEIQTGLLGQYAAVLRTRLSDEPAPPLASISRGTRIRVFVAYPILEKSRLWGIVYLSRSPQSILKHLHAEKQKVIIAGISIMLLTGLLALFTSYTVTRPIYKLVKAIRKNEEQYTQEFPKLSSFGTTEIELLALTFEKMAHSIEERSNYIKDFAAHVSHEFKTPLTSIRGAAELLLEHFDEMETERREKFIKNIVSDSDRLKQLVSRLLELAQADNALPQQESVELAPFLRLLQAEYGGKSLEVSYNKDSETIAGMSHEALSMVFGNLLENALQHGADKVSIVEVESDEEGVRLQVIDNGEGISSANKDKIFTPFFTTKRSNGGTGLGLQIVQSILQAYGGSITVGGSKKKGATFVVQLPKVANHN